MNYRQQMEERLWDFIDGHSSATERSTLEDLIARDPEWKLVYRELLATHQYIAAVEPDSPSMRFTTNVMEEITGHRVAPATNSYVNKSIVRGIAAFFLITLGCVFVFFLTQFHGSGDPANNLPSQNWPSFDLSSYNQAFQNHLGKFNWDRWFNNHWLHVVIMVNLILGLMLIDKYLHWHRNRSHYKEPV